MRKYILLALSLFLIFDLSAQTRRMASSESGKSYTAQNQYNTVMPLLQEADRHFRAQNYDAAFLTLENAVAKDPDSPEALIQRALLKQVMGMTTEAEIDYQNAVRMNPYVADVYGYRGANGLLNMLSFQPELAIQDLEEDKKYTYYYGMIDSLTQEGFRSSEELTLTEQAVGFFEAGDMDMAKKIIGELLESYPNSALAHDLQGQVFFSEGNLDLAEQSFLQAMSMNPYNAIAWYNLAQTEHRLGNLQAAKEYLDRAIEIQEDLTKAHFERAIVLKKMGDKESALVDYDKIIELRGSDYAEAYLNRDLTKKMLGIYGGALDDINKVIDVYPNNAELLKNRANLYVLLGLPLKAIEEYTNAIQKDSDYAEAYFNRAVTHFILFDRISGCADLQSAVDLKYDKAEEFQRYFCMD